MWHWRVTCVTQSPPVRRSPRGREQRDSRGPVSRLRLGASPRPGGPGPEKDWRLLGDAEPSAQQAGAEGPSLCQPRPPLPSLPNSPRHQCHLRLLGEARCRPSGAGGHVFPACRAPEHRPVEAFPVRWPRRLLARGLSRQDVFIPLSVTTSLVCFPPRQPGSGI